MNETTYIENYATLEQLARRFEKNVITESVFMTLMDELAAVLIDSSYTLEQEDHMANLFGNSLHQYLKYTFAHAISMENKISSKIITAGAFDELMIANSFWHNMFAGIARDEVALLKVDSNSKVKQIGTGPLPLLAVLYHRFSGCVVTCVEKDIASVERARKFIAVLDLADVITVEQGMGQEVDLDRFTHVSVSQHTIYKPEIYSHIRTTMHPDLSVLVRTNARIGDIFFADDVEKMVAKAGFKITKRGPLGNKTTAALLIEPTQL